MRLLFPELIPFFGESTDPKLTIRIRDFTELGLLSPPLYIILKERLVNPTEDKIMTLHTELAKHINVEVIHPTFMDWHAVATAT